MAAETPDFGDPTDPETEFEAIWWYFNLCKTVYGIGPRWKLLENFPSGAISLCRRIYIAVLTFLSLLFLFEFFYLSFAVERDPLIRILLAVRGFGVLLTCFGGCLFMKDAKGYAECLRFSHELAKTDTIFVERSKESRNYFRKVLLSLIIPFAFTYVGQSFFNSLINGTPTLGLPVYIPFYPISSMKSFVVNLVLQTWPGMAVPFAWSGIFGVIAVSTEYLKALIEVMVRNLNLLQDEVEPRRVQATLKIVVQMHCQWIQFQAKLIKLTSMVIFTFELGTISLLVIVWITVVIAHAEYFTAISCSGLFLVHFTLYWVSESTASCYETLGMTVYDLNWYEMRPRERKMLAFMVSAMNRQQMMTVGSFFKANFEHFYKFCTQTYAYCVFFDRLIREAVGIP